MRRYLFVLCCCVLSACAGLRENHATPAADLPLAWSGMTGSAPADQAGPWWKAFKDPELSKLIDEVLARNNDLAAAAVRVRRAQLQARLAGSDLLPDASLGGDMSASRVLDSGNISRSHRVSAGLNYELDLWGKLAAARDAAIWEAMASEEDRLSLKLSLIGTVAKTYWQLGFLHERLARVEAGIATAAQILDLVRVRHEAGAASGLDLAQAKQELAQRQAERSALIEERTRARLALSLLFDQAPQTMMAEPIVLPQGEVPGIAAGIPAELLGRRPDLRAAELRLRSSLAEIDQARASFYPALTLTTSLGSSSQALRSVLENPIATLGAGLVLPFVQWNSLRLRLEVSQNRYEEAVLNFRQTLYQALSEVEQALAVRQRHEEQRDLLQFSWEQADLAERLSATRYDLGAISLGDWLEAREKQRSAQIALAENHWQRLNALMDIYLALGGEDTATRFGSIAP